MSNNNTLANQFTKEAIKTRMIQHAAHLWGVKSPAALDPLVKLLIEAFSTEIYRAANETQNIEGRILDKIAHLLTPTVLTASRPAHAVMQAQPQGESLVLHPLTRFSFQNRLQRNEIGSIKNEDIRISFSPVRHTKIIKGHVAVIANSYQVFSVDNSGFKQPLLRTSQPLPWAGCWVGLLLDAAVKDLDGVSLYFDFPSYVSGPGTYQLLPLCKIYCNGRAVAATPGQPQIGQPENVTVGKDIFQSREVLNQIHSEIEKMYDHKFLTLGHCDVSQQNMDIPAELTAAFGADSLKGKLPQGLVWLKIIFPSNYSYDLLSNLDIAINAFPVSNRTLITGIFSYKGLNSILPLRTEVFERFLAVHKVTDGKGREYTELPYTQQVKGQSGFYSIRQGGVERFDQRSAQDMVSYLIELTRDEVAAFSSLDQTFIRTSLDALSKQLRQVENKTSSLDKYIRHTPSYLVLEPIDDDENIQVEYWVTEGINANHIRPGTRLTCQNNQDVDAHSGVLLTESFGGKEPLKAGERLNMFRYALSSKNRLITLEDIRSFCFAELGNKITQVNFSKGLEMSPHPKQGYIRTLEIVLTPAQYHELDEPGWQQLADTLLTRIRNLSLDGANYRLRIAHT